jgi:hypothetical protein
MPNFEIHAMIDTCAKPVSRMSPADARRPVANMSDGRLANVRAQRQSGNNRATASRQLFPNGSAVATSWKELT